MFRVSEGQDSAILERNGNQVQLADGFRKELSDLSKALDAIKAQKDNDLSQKLVKAQSNIRSKIYDLVDYINNVSSFIKVHGQDVSTDRLKTILTNAGTSDISTNQQVGEYKLGVLLHNLTTGMFGQYQGVFKALGINDKYSNPLQKSNAIPIPAHVYSINELVAELNIISDGDGTTFLDGGKRPVSLYGFSEKLTTFETGGITLAMYHLASGNNDYN